MSEPQNSRQKKLGDGVDMMLHYGRIAQERGEILVIYDYPETLQKILKAFVKTWGIGEECIPRKPKNGRGEYAQWVNELQDISSLCGSFPDKTIKDSLSLYQETGMNFMVTHPLAIKKLLVELKRRKNLSVPKELTEPLKEFQPLPQSDTENNKEELTDMVKNLKKELFGER